MTHPERCPYCGHHHTMVHAVADKVFIRCCNCQLMSPNCETRDEAIKVWNSIKISKELQP